MVTLLLLVEEGRHGLKNVIQYHAVALVWVKKGLGGAAELLRIPGRYRFDSFHETYGRRRLLGAP